MNLEIWKKAKKSLGITFDELAEKTNISVSTLKDIFRGKTYAPRIDTVQSIEKALGINSAWTDDDYQNGVSLTKKVSITPIEEDLLDAFRPFLQKYGEKGKDCIIAMLNAFSELNKQ